VGRDRHRGRTALRRGRHGTRALATNGPLARLAHRTGYGFPRPRSRTARRAAGRIRREPVRLGRTPAGFRGRFDRPRACRGRRRGFFSALSPSHPARSRDGYGPRAPSGEAAWVHRPRSARAPAAQGMDCGARPERCDGGARRSRAGERRPAAEVTRAGGSAASGSTTPRSRARPSAPPTGRADPRGPSPAPPGRSPKATEPDDHADFCRGCDGGNRCADRDLGSSPRSARRQGKAAARAPCRPSRPRPVAERRSSGSRGISCRERGAGGSSTGARLSLPRPPGREEKPALGAPSHAARPRSVPERRPRHGRRSRPRDRRLEGRPAAAHARIDGSPATRFGRSAAGVPRRYSQRRAAPSLRGHARAGEEGCAPSRGPHASGPPRLSGRGADRDGLSRCPRGRRRAPAPDDREDQGSGGGIAPPRDRRLRDGFDDRRRPVELGIDRAGRDRGGSRTEPIRESVGRTRRASTSVAHGPRGSIGSRRSGLVGRRGVHGRRDKGARTARLGRRGALRARHRPGDRAA
jgi:hypothetical protein